MRLYPTGPRRRALLLPSCALWALAAGCGCAGEEAPTFSGEGSFARLELSPTGAPIEFPELELLQRWHDFEEGDDHAGWSVRGGELQIRRYQGQEILQIPRKQQDVVIEVPVDAEIRGRCLMTATMRVRGETVTFGASLFSGKEKVGTTQVKVDPKPDLNGVHFLIDVDGGETVRVDRLTLRIPKGKTPVQLRTLNLKQGALGMELGSVAFGRFDLIEIDGDARRATALPSGHGLGTSFGVERSADVLRFSYARPESLVVKGQRVSLQLALEGGGKLAEHEFYLDDVDWQHAQVSLEDFVGEEVQATWSLDPSHGDAVCVLAQPRYSTNGARAPTVLLVTSDTHRSDHVGFLMEEGELRTDAIDELAAQGVVFLDAVSSVNNTTPSHISLFTGLTPRDTGIVANAKRLADAAPTLAEAFHDQGYLTLASVSATPVNYKLCGLGQGFDRYSIPVKKGVRDSQGTIGVLMDWLGDCSGEPVFMWLHIYDAHGPYAPPADMQRLYYDEHKDPYDPEAEGADPSLAPYWNHDIADPAYTEALYKSEITYLDDRLGELFRLPRVQDGIVAFTSDHGEVLRYGPGDPFDHRGLSLNTLAVPLIFKAPGLTAGERRDDPVQQIDVGRTLLDLAGLGHLEFPGRNVLSSTLQKGEPRFALQANGISASVLTDEWMLSITLRVPGSTNEVEDELYHSVELYDLREDPVCRYNVWEQNPDKAATLRRAVIRWLEQAQRNDWESASVVSQEDIQKELADLGYVTVEDSTASEWFDSSCECSWCQRFAE